MKATRPPGDDDHEHGCEFRCSRLRRKLSRLPATRDAGRSNLSVDGWIFKYKFALSATVALRAGEYGETERQIATEMEISAGHFSKTRCLEVDERENTVLNLFLNH